MNLISVEVNDFTLGQVAKFEILLENLWNTPINNFFIEMNVFDDNNNIKTTYTTPLNSIDSLAKKKLYSYWDTKNIDIGQYLANIKIHYNGNSIEENYYLSVSQDKISTSLTGKVINTSNETQGNLTATLIIIVLINIVVTVFFYFKKNKK